MEPDSVKQFERIKLRISGGIRNEFHQIIDTLREKKEKGKGREGLSFYLHFAAAKTIILIKRKIAPKINKKGSSCEILFLINQSEIENGSKIRIIFKALFIFLFPLRNSIFLLSYLGLRLQNFFIAPSVL